MFKHVLSALVMSSVMASGAAFAADQGAPSSQAPAATAKTEQLGTAEGKVTPAKHQKVVHKRQAVKSDTPKASETTAEKSN
jgi:hypothetical protein